MSKPKEDSVEERDPQAQPGASNMRASDAHRRPGRETDDIHAKKTRPEAVVLQREPRDGSERPSAKIETIHRRDTSPPPSLEYSGAVSLKTMPPPPEYTVGAEQVEEAPPQSSVTPSTRKRLRTGSLFGRPGAGRPVAKETSLVVERVLADLKKDNRSE